MRTSTTLGSVPSLRTRRRPRSRYIMLSGDNPGC